MNGFFLTAVTSQGLVTERSLRTRSLGAHSPSRESQVMNHLRGSTGLYNCLSFPSRREACCLGCPNARFPTPSETSNDFFKETHTSRLFLHCLVYTGSAVCSPKTPWREWI